MLDSEIERVLSLWNGDSKAIKDTIARLAALAKDTRTYQVGDRRRKNIDDFLELCNGPLHNFCPVTMERESGIEKCHVLEHALGQRVSENALGWRRLLTSSSCTRPSWRR